jgi:hypothetical protein
MQNIKDLMVFIKTLTKYNPVIDEIQILNYEPYVTLVSDSMSPYIVAHKDLKDAQNEADNSKSPVKDIIHKIRNVLFEISGKSLQYDDYNEITDIVIGDNVRKHSYDRKNSDETPGTPFINTTGGSVPDEKFQSVSQKDLSYILAKFTALFDTLSEYVKYLSEETDLKVPALRNTTGQFSDRLKALATKMANSEAQYSAGLPIFYDISSIHERAELAKVHVKRANMVQSLSNSKS